MPDAVNRMPNQTDCGNSLPPVSSVGALPAPVNSTTPVFTGAPTMTNNLAERTTGVPLDMNGLNQIAQRKQWYQRP